jgi:DNA-3-methyladenine glycosylase II
MQAHAQLAASDPVMARLIERLGELSLEHRRRVRVADDLGALLRAIVGQQVSTGAATAIWGRFLELFGGDVPSAAQLLAVDAARLRAAGLSGRKVEYVRDLARHVTDGELELARLEELSDDEVIAEISAVRGLGPWTAQIFLIHRLERPDVLPASDLGIRRAVRLQYGLDGPPSEADVIRIGEAWRPHRTLACVYLWHSLRHDPIEASG